MSFITLILISLLDVPHMLPQRFSLIGFSRWKGAEKLIFAMLEICGQQKAEGSAPRTCLQGFEVVPASPRMLQKPAQHWP